MEEWLTERGPCYCDTTHLQPEEAEDLLIDYLNERPSFVLFLASRGQDITKEPIEIYGSDPYIVGGHTGSGFWVDTAHPGRPQAHGPAGAASPGQTHGRHGIGRLQRRQSPAGPHAVDRKSVV